MVIYGGKEILHDDIVEFVETLEKVLPFSPHSSISLTFAYDRLA